MHAPSLTHARTAAVLRSGYLANATPPTRSPMAVEPLVGPGPARAGASWRASATGRASARCSATSFERGLHDEHGLAEVDKFIYPLRKAVPARRRRAGDHDDRPGVPIEAIEARNVMDGRKLVGADPLLRRTRLPVRHRHLPAATAAEAAAINAEANGLLDVYDAIADLALAEGVHQAAQGNFDRIAATLDAYSTGNFPARPEVVQTPPSGTGLTHRVAVHLQPGLAAPAEARPRGRTPSPRSTPGSAALLPHARQASAAW